MGIWVADEVETLDGEVLAAGGEGDVDWAGVDGACKSKGASIGIEEAENRIILSYVFIPSIVSFDLFKTLLGNFVTLTEKWQEQYESLLGSLGSSESMESIPNPFEFTRI